MTKSEAQATANEYIKLILQHQQPFQGHGLANTDLAKRSAEAIAAFRRELIAQLTSQPEN